MTRAMVPDAAAPVVPTGATRLALGLDVGGSSVKFALIDTGAAHRVATSGTLPISPARSVDEVLRAIEAIRDDLPPEARESASIGVGLPGIFDPDDGTPTLFPNFPDEWIGFRLRHAIEGVFGRRVRLVNDAKAFSIAESIVGAGAGFADVVGVTLGTGVGGGVVRGGRLWEGQGSAGELGHLTVELDGPVCGCGNRGCVETYAGAEAVARNGGHPTALEVFDAASAGDERAMRAVDLAAAALGAGLANVYVTIAPDVFVLGGGMMAAGDRLRVAVEREIRQRVRVAPADRITVVAGSLGRGAGAIGSALVGADEAARHVGGRS